MAISAERAAVGGRRVAGSGQQDLVMPHTDHHPHPYHGPSRAEVLADRKQYCNPAIFTLYKEPLMIV